MRKLLALLVLTASGCPDVNVDTGEVVVGPTVEFDPARSLETGARFIPFPNDLARDPTTGKVNLGPQACESASAAAIREGVLNTLDGFGTYEVPMQVTFTEEVDEASLDGNIVVYQVAEAGQPLDPTTAMPVPVIFRKTTTVRFSTGDCTMPEQVHAVVIIPTIPLRQKATYVVALKSGITTVGGEPFQPSVTWALVASQQAPVTLDDQGQIIADLTPLDPANPEDRAQLLALHQLWTGLAPVLAFLDATAEAPAARSDLLVAFAFTTQTTTDQLDRSVATSPAAMLPTTGFAVQPSPLDFGPAAALCGQEALDDPTQCFLKLALGGCAPLTTGCTAENYATGNALCASVFACAAVGGVFGGAIGTINFQTQLPNPTPGLPPLQGPWSDPVNPMPQESLALETVATVPAGPPPAGGWPVVVFGHGVTSSKESVFAIAGRMAAAGFATVAIDFSQHGSRAVRTSEAVTLGCKGHCFAADGTTDTGTECDTIMDCDFMAGETCGSLAATPSLVPPSPSSAPQCYASIFSTDLANTRDNIRQTVLDLQRVALALAACGTDSCGPLSVDPERIFYAGFSLGSIIGTTVAATTPEIQAAALNVGGVGWLDVLENTDTLALRCQLVNSLIDAGVLMGEKWTGGDTGLCTTDAWKMQPGYAQFAAIARWVIDPADPANFALRLRMKPHLIQEVVGDTVVPNIATERQAALTGVMPVASDPFNPGDPFAETAAIATNPTQSKYVTYTSDTNHEYLHSSLLRPAMTEPPERGVFGTLRLQVDLVQFLDNNDDDSL